MFELDLTCLWLGAQLEMGTNQKIGDAFWFLICQGGRTMNNKLTGFSDELTNPLQPYKMLPAPTVETPKILFYSRMN